MFGKKCRVMICFAVLTCIPTYSSSPITIHRPSINITPAGDCNSREYSESMGKAILLYPKRISLQILQKLSELYVAYPSAVEDFMRELISKSQYEMDNKKMTAEHVATMIENLENTISVAKDPSKCSTLLHGLPDLNKYLLREVARSLKDKYPEYDTMFYETNSSLNECKLPEVYSAMKQINYAYRSGIEYSKYFTLEHIVYLTVVWVVGYITEQKGEHPIVESESVVSIIPYVMEAEEKTIGNNTEFYKLLMLLDEKLGGME